MKRKKRCENDVNKLIFQNLKKFSKMYFSEFTLRLIDEVKKHEVLYNNRYDKRPKQEKEEAWMEIASALDGKYLTIITH